MGVIRRYPNLAHYSALLLIIAAGAVLRFWDLDSPPLWGDDAATWSRICGSYQEMLDALREAGFGPLHYELYWWIAQGMPLPFGWGAIKPDGIPMLGFAMRIVPTIAGILMIPAMYFLARQLTSRNTALLVALLTAFSAYLLNYSRDAKMYMHLWLCVTLHVGALLWFIRTRSLTAWLLFVAAGCGMLGLQRVATLVLAIDALIVLTAGRGYWYRIPQLIALCAWAVLLPIFGLIEWIDRRFRWDLARFGSRGPMGRMMRRVSGTFILPSQLPLVLPIALGLLICYLGPYGYKAHFNVFNERVSPDTVNYIRIDLMRAGLPWVPVYNRDRDAGDLLLFTATSWLTGWEWPRENNQPYIDPRTLNLRKTASIALIVLLIAGLFPWRSAWARLRRRPANEAVSVLPAGQRGIAWMLLWLVVPTYGMYAISLPADQVSSPTDLLLRVTMTDPEPVVWPRYPGGIEDRRFASREPTADDRRTFWSDLPRAIRETLARFGTSKVNWWNTIGLVAIGMLVVLLVPGGWRRRGYLVGMSAALLLLVITLCTAIHVFIADTPGSLWMPRYLAVAYPAFLVICALLFVRLPTRPLRWTAVLLFIAANLVHFHHRVTASEPPTDVMSADLIAAEKDPSLRVWQALAIRGGNEPGTATFGSMTMTMYLAEMSGMDVGPADVRLDVRRRDRRFGPNPVIQRFVPERAGGRSMIAREANRRRELQRIIIWDSLPPTSIDQLDQLGQALGSNWRKVDEQIWIAYDHWTCGQWAQCRRRVYERVAPPAEPAAPVAASIISDPSH